MKRDLDKATIVIKSLLNKCEKSLQKLTNGTSQHTLLINRIEALKIALTLIEKEILNKTTNS
ncbi:hypothetical protein ABIB40_001485 [Pedobacter sp. UYP30]|uniref:hypothetical protein n=1 Tax=Pedobacter sp. UYP30 TaxID=1756400 RepID=UPI0033970B4A